jgi:tetratricopeptide (TPR) repeat protein
MQRIAAAMIVLTCFSMALVAGSDNAAAQVLVDDGLPLAASATATQPVGVPDFAGQGELDFKAGRYSAAVKNWQHALVDEPLNGGIVLMLSQALFQTGKFDEAAGAAQAALRMLPPDKWGVVVANYKELYGTIQDYTNQIKVLEKARDAKPDDPAIHFLLGYHFGFLGFPKHAVKELEKVNALEPKDEVAVKLRDRFKAKLDDAGPAKPPAPAATDEKPDAPAPPAEKSAAEKPASEKST